MFTNNDQDTLNELYTPWCGQCKKLASIFHELGTKMKDEGAGIVKMDAIAIDVPSAFQVRGFPISWLPKDCKSRPQQYHCCSELDDFVKCLVKHATSELRGWGRAWKVKKTERKEHAAVGSST